MKNKHSLIHCWWECKIVQQHGKTVWHILIKLNILLQYDPTTPHLGIYPTELKVYSHTKTHIEMFIVILFILAKAETTQMSSIGKHIKRGMPIQ